MATTAEISPTEFLKKTVGTVLYPYYLFLEYFHQRPSSCEDLVDGLLYIESRQYAQAKAMAKAEQQWSSKHGKH